MVNTSAGRNGPFQAAMDDIVVSQQSSINGQTGRVLQMIAADMVTVDEEEKGLFTGLANFLKAKPIHNEGALERAIHPLAEALRAKARIIGADAVLNVRVHTTRGVDTRGERLIRLSAIGTAVCLHDDQNKEE